MTHWRAVLKLLPGFAVLLALLTSSPNVVMDGVALQLPHPGTVPVVTTAPIHVYDGPGQHARPSQSSIKATVDATVPDRQPNTDQRDHAVASDSRVAAEAIPAGDAAVIGRSQAMFNSPELGALRSAHGSGVSAEVNIGGSVIRYEPSYSGSGMTMFGDDGFILGRHAFSSQEELAKTLLHENYRLGYSQVPGIGANGDLVAKETGNAFDFAEMYFGHLLGGG